MKKLISILAGVVLAVNAFATGNEGVNPPQSGLIANAVTNQITTNSFAFPFQVAPVLTIYPIATNGTPVTNVFVTTTNFAISFPPSGTNAAFGWSAVVGGTKMEYGTQSFIVGTGSTNITFPAAYAVAPVVVVTSGLTNAPTAITSITTSNFTISSYQTQTNQWMSIGIVASPASEYTGMFPVNNKVLAP